jgi:hypothetical protein
MAVPAERGNLQAELQDGRSGLEVAQVPAPLAQKAARGAGKPPFEQGDIVLSIDGHPTPNLAAYETLLNPSTGLVPNTTYQLPREQPARDR